MKLFSRMIKPVIFFAAAVFALSLLSSCGESEKSVLWYQDEIKTAVVEVNTKLSDETYTMEISLGEEKSALLTAPAEYSGIKFTLKDGEAFASYGGNDYGTIEGGLGSMEKVFGAFEIKEDQIAHMFKNDDGDTVIDAMTEGGVYGVVLTEEGYPKEISFDGVSVLRMKVLSINEKSHDDTLLSDVGE